MPGPDTIQSSHTFTNYYLNNSLNINVQLITGSY
jgi:hypothetical protein